MNLLEKARETTKALAVTAAALDRVLEWYEEAPTEKLEAVELAIGEQFPFSVVHTALEQARKVLR